MQAGVTQLSRIFDFSSSCDDAWINLNQQTSSYRESTKRNFKYLLKTKRKMFRKLGAKFVIMEILLLIILMRASLAAGFHECLKDAKSDNKIRIGFLSRYKSSKVSMTDNT